MSGPRSPGRALAWAAAVAALCGCGPRGASSHAPAVESRGTDDRSHADPTEPHEGETAPELAERLRRLRAQQGAHLAAAARDPEVCESVCSLASSICGVKEKLCRLADDRPGDETYQQYCREAKLACKNAQDNCMACVESLDAGK